VSFLDPQTILRAGGYVLLTAIIFAECGLLIGFFLPGDSLLFTAGLFASQNVLGLDIWVLTVLCGLAAIFGPLVGYWYGKALGPRLFSREDSLFFHKQHLVRAHEFYERHGGKALILARFMPIVRTFVPIVAGVSHMNQKRYSTYNLVGAVLWGFGLTVGGFVIGYIPPIKDFVTHYIDVILIAAVVLSLGPTLFHVLRNHQKAKRGQREAPTAD
jgi:membrane-associated protein